MAEEVQIGVPVFTHKKGGGYHFYMLNAHFIFAKYWTVLHLSERVVVLKVSKLMQYNAHETWSAPVGLNVVCLCLHLKKGKDHFDTFNAHFIFVQFLIILHLSKNGRCLLI